MEQFPIYRPSPFEKAYELTGAPPVPANADGSTSTSMASACSTGSCKKPDGAGLACATASTRRACSGRSRNGPPRRRLQWELYQTGNGQTASEGSPGDDERWLRVVAGRDAQGRLRSDQLRRR